MPVIVLRHPDVLLPWLFQANDDGVVPYSVKEAGWDIDHDTDPAAAALEVAPVVETAPVVPSFAAPPTDAPADVPVEQTPAGQQAVTDTQPAEPVTTQEA